MSLFEEVAALVPRRPGPPCTVAVVLDRLEGDDRADLLRLLADRFVPGTLISRALIARRHAVKPQTIQRHRNALCSCADVDAA